jgi:trans-aconitate methyltransferase
LIKLKGIDLVDTFLVVDKHITCVEFESESLIDWKPDQTYDLITCVHGLHYLGDKLKVIEASIKALNQYGLFVANLDLTNIVIQGTNTSSYLKNSFKRYGVAYNSRLKVLKQLGRVALNSIVNIWVLTMNTAKLYRSGFCNFILHLHLTTRN